MRRLPLLGSVLLLPACTAMQSAPPERVAELKAKAAECQAELGYPYTVDRFGLVHLPSSYEGRQREAFDCVFGRGKWARRSPGQPVNPMVPLRGTERPDPMQRVP